MTGYAKFGVGADGSASMEHNPSNGSSPGAPDARLDVYPTSEADYPVALKISP
jgi:hypothetical protein